MLKLYSIYEQSKEDPNQFRIHYVLAADKKEAAGMMKFPVGKLHNVYKEPMFKGAKARTLGSTEWQAMFTFKNELIQPIPVETV